MKESRSNRDKKKKRKSSSKFKKRRQSQKVSLTCINFRSYQFVVQQINFIVRNHLMKKCH